MIVPKLVFQLHDDDDDTVREVEPDKDHVHDHANFFKNDNHGVETQQDDIKDDDVDGKRSSLVRQDEEDKEYNNDDYCTLSSPWSTSNQCQDDDGEVPHRSSIGDFGDDQHHSFLGRNVVDDDVDNDSGSRICSISDLYGVNDNEDNPPASGMRHLPDDLIDRNKENVDAYDNICSISDLQGLDKKQQGVIGLDDNEDVFTMSNLVGNGSRDPNSDYSPGRERREGVDMSSILPSIADLQALDGGTEKELPRKQTELDFNQPLDAAVTLQSPEEEESVDGIWFRTNKEVCVLYKNCDIYFFFKFILLFSVRTLL